MQSKKDQSLEALKRILLHEDQLKLEQLETELSALRNQIADKESLISSLDPVIADLLERKIAGSKDEMAAALAPIMGEAIRHQIADAKEDVVDALYPIIGKTIRKSVAEAMKNLVESVNQKIDNALRQNLFRKFIHSKITGVSEGELALKDAMPFQIEELFLIHKATGLLLSHVSSQKAGVKIDEDLISGMLTAIRNFASEAFTSAEKQDLEKIQYESSTIVVEMGHHSYLAAVISGIEPGQFDNDIRTLNQKIHNQYHKPLRKFDGDITQFGEMPRLLKRFLKKYDRKIDIRKPKKSKPYLRNLLFSIVLICLTIIAFTKIPDYLANRKTQNLVKAKIEAIPELNRQNIKYRASNGWLTIRGNVSTFRQREQIDSLVQTVTGITGFDNYLTISDTEEYSQEIINTIHQQLSQSVEFRNLNPKFIVANSQVTIEGKAPNHKIKRDLGFLVSEIAGIKVVINNLEVIKNNELSFDEIKHYLRQKTVCFKMDSTVTPENEYAKLDSIFNRISTLEDIELVIKGYSDDLADSAYNVRLTEQRARTVANYFASRGFPRDNIVIEGWGEKSAIASNETEEGRSKNRRVEFDIIPKR